MSIIAGGLTTSPRDRLCCAGTWISQHLGWRAARSGRWRCCAWSPWASCWCRPRPGRRHYLDPRRGCAEAPIRLWLSYARPPSAPPHCSTSVHLSRAMLITTTGLPAAWCLPCSATASGAGRHGPWAGMRQTQVTARCVGGQFKPLLVILMLLAVSTESSVGPGRDAGSAARPRRIRHQPAPPNLRVFAIAPAPRRSTSWDHLGVQRGHQRRP